MIIETRRVQHPRRLDAHERIAVKDGRMKREKADDPGGVGSQIVRTQRVCPECAATASPAAGPPALG